jgi:hypothetical protein
MAIASPVLISKDGAPPIKFQLNPVMLESRSQNKTQQNPGANNAETGTPKVSFSEKLSNIVEIKDIYYDNYESGKNVITEFIVPYQKATEFVQDKNTKTRRPPVYEFSWGTQRYLRRCFVKSFSYKIVMFASDGTPVRAIVDVLLEEVEDTKVSNQAGNPVSPTPAQRVNSGGTGLFSAIGGWLDDIFP